MTLTILIIVSFFILMAIFFIVEKVKHKKLNGEYKKLDGEYEDKLRIEKQKLNTKFNQMKEILSDSKLIGYYNERGWTWKDDKKIEFNVFVEEVDRYTNGESRVRLHHIEPIRCPSQAIRFLEEKVKEIFLTVRKTSDIEWLISENEIKEVRRKKLEAIEKLHKNK